MYPRRPPPRFGERPNFFPIFFLATFFTQKCYPRTYKEELAEDIFRIYDLDNNGSVDFQVTSHKKI